MSGSSQRTGTTISVVLVVFSLLFVAYCARRNLFNPYVVSILVILLVFACSFARVPVPSMFKGKEDGDGISKRIGGMVGKATGQTTGTRDDDEGSPLARHRWTHHRLLHRGVAGAGR